MKILKHDLTEENYFTLAIDTGYLSSHQFRSFAECPAKEIARLKGEYDPGDKRHYAIGRYIDGALTTPKRMGKLVHRDREIIFKKPAIKKCEAWCQDQKEPVAWDFKKNPIEDFFKQYPQVWESGDKMADVILADAMIAAAKSDKAFMAVMKGQCQMILVGELDGIAIKGIPDVINPPKERFTDLKSSKDFGTLWDVELRKRVPWYEFWGYWTQLALYQELIRQNYDMTMLPIIAGISKKTPPGRQIVCFEDQERLDRELQKLRDMIPSIKRWKSGEEVAPACGKIDDCDWCRQHAETKILTAESHR